MSHDTHNHKSLDCLNYGRDEYRAKSMHSRLALVERGLGPAIPSANSSQVGNVEPWQSCCKRAGLRAGEQMQSRSSSGAHTVARQPRPASSSTGESNARAVSSPARELNPATLSTRLRAGTQCPRGRASVMQAMPRCARASLRGYRRPCQNDELEIGRYQTRPACHDTERKIARRVAERGLQTPDGPELRYTCRASDERAPS